MLIYVNFSGRVYSVGFNLDDYTSFGSIASLCLYVVHYCIFIMLCIRYVTIYARSKILFPTSYIYIYIYMLSVLILAYVHIYG